MRAIIGLLVALAVAFGFYYFYFKTSRPGGEGTSAVQAINTTAVKNDLIAIANAERMHLSEKGSYVSLEELIDSGELRMEKPRRENYVYTVETNGSGFTVTARYDGPPGLRYPTLTIDQTMQIRQSE